MNTLNSFFVELKNLKPILIAIKQAEATSYLVGGSVRDIILKKSVKDIDIEVHGIELGTLETTLQKFGPVRLVGKQFGVLMIDGYDVDWSLPRRDSTGRKPEVIIDHTMDIKQACKRRDLTMNAMAIDLNELLENMNHIKTKDDLRIIDPYNGLNDIKHKQLRAVDTKLFLEDPLRFFRVMQFIGRFEMQPDKELNELCSTMPLHDLETKKTIARERIFEELKKLILKSRRPSLGFHWLDKIGRLKEIFPELAILTATPQKVVHHPEGDVFEHTMQALDAAAALEGYQATDRYSLEQEKLIIMLATLCHDLGKPLTIKDDLTCYGHDIAGVTPTKILLKRITDDTALIKNVCTLVRYHMQPFAFISNDAKKSAYKRLAAKLAPELSLRHLALLSCADSQGRNKKKGTPLQEIPQEYLIFLDRSQKASVLHQAEKPILQGKDLIDVIQPGPKMGKLLKKAYDIQINEGIIDAKELKKRLL